MGIFITIKKSGKQGSTGVKCLIDAITVQSNNQLESNKVPQTSFVDFCEWRKC